MNNQLILISDSDPKNLQILKENLEASGFQVITVAEGNKAWEEIQRNRPQLVLTEINLPMLNGFQLLEKIQADPNTSNIPLIYLTNQRDVQQRVRSFQMGAKDYLIKPLHVKEVIAHIRMVLRRIGQKSNDHTSQHNKISGSLAELSLADLIESFSVERKTGILSLNNGNNKTGYIYFRDGSVINASLGAIRLENAIYKMLPWDKGYFNMELKEVDVPDEISISNLGLLLEGMKRMEKLHILLQKFPSSKTAFTITSTFQKIIEKKKLPADVKKFILLLDGKKNIDTILHESSYDDFKTLERLLRLYQQGFIKPTIAAKIKQQEDAAPISPIETKKTSLALPKDDSFDKLKKLASETIQKPEIETGDETSETSKAPDMMKPIQHRIDSHRAELIIPKEMDAIDHKGNGQQIKEDHIKEQEPVAEQPIQEKEEYKTPFETEMLETPILDHINAIDQPEDEPQIREDQLKKQAPVEEKSIPEKDESKQPIETSDFDTPLFNREEFIKKQQTIHKKEEWKPPVATRKPDKYDKSQSEILSNLQKNQILTIGLDEDSLDEIMDILTENTFQTKKIDALPDLQIHFGNIAHDEFKFITLVGFFANNTFINLVNALSKKLIGIIFGIDCTKTDMWEYASYLIHTVNSNFDLPFAIAALNYQEMNSINIEVIRYKLGVDKAIPIIVWDTDDNNSIRELLSSIIFPPENNKKSAVIIENLVENVTV